MLLADHLNLAIWSEKANDYTKAQNPKTGNGPAWLGFFKKCNQGIPIWFNQAYFLANMVHNTP